MLLESTLLLALVSKVLCTLPAFYTLTIEPQYDGTTGPEGFTGAKFGLGAQNLNIVNIHNRLLGGNRGLKRVKLESQGKASQSGVDLYSIELLSVDLSDDAGQLLVIHDRPIELCRGHSSPTGTSTQPRRAACGNEPGKDNVETTSNVWSIDAQNHLFALISETDQSEWELRFYTEKRWELRPETRIYFCSAGPRGTRAARPCDDVGTGYERINIVLKPELL